MEGNVEATTAVQLKTEYQKPKIKEDTDKVFKEKSVISKEMTEEEERETAKKLFGF